MVHVCYVLEESVVPIWQHAVQVGGLSENKRNVDWELAGLGLRFQ